MGRKKKTRRKHNMNRDNRDERGWRPETVKENAALVKYYQGQGIVPEGEWEIFHEKLKQTLPVTFRITGYKGQAQELLKFIQGQYFNRFVDVEVDGQKVEPPTCLQWYPDKLAWQLELTKKAIRASEPLKQLHEFLVSETESGNLSRQEAVSMIPPIVLDVKPHHKVLDMCAAPGSKTAQLIEYLHSDETQLIPEGFVVANDSDNKRCYLMTHQVKRLQSPNCMIINHDATILPNMSTLKAGSPPFVAYDRVLADVPCSGDGTIRKNADIWRKWNPTMGMNLHGLQFRILKRGLELLAVGGRLVYSTCSLNPIEDEAVLAAMLKKCEGAVELVEVKDMLPGLRCLRGLSKWRCMSRKEEWYERWEEVPKNYQSTFRPSMFPPDPEHLKDMNLDRCLRILPHHQDTGGFFIGVLRKVRPLPWRKTFKTPEGDIESEAVSESNMQKEISQPPSGETENQEEATTATSSQEEAPITDGSEAGQSPEKRKRENLENLPNAKKQKTGQQAYKEDPYFFLEKDDPLWPPIKEFFKISDDFPADQLMFRCADGKKRNLYFVTDFLKQLVQQNEDRIKFINLGVKMFGRSPSPLVPNCDFRLAQDGLNVLRGFSSGRKILLSRDDLVTLLREENPYLTKLSDSVQRQVDQINPGSTIFHFTPSESDSQPACEIMVCGWKGKTSLRSFVPKFERSHYLRLCGLELSELQKEIADKKAAKKAEKRDEEGMEEGEDSSVEEEEKQRVTRVEIADDDKTDNRDDDRDDNGHVNSGQSAAVERTSRVTEDSGHTDTSKEQTEEDSTNLAD